MVQYQLSMGIWDVAHRRGWGWGWGEDIINKALRNSESTLAGIRKKNFKKNWSICRHGRTDGERFGNLGGS